MKIKKEYKLKGEEKEIYWFGEYIKISNIEDDELIDYISSDYGFLDKSIWVEVFIDVLNKRRIKKIKKICRN